MRSYVNFTRLPKSTPTLLEKAEQEIALLNSSCEKGSSQNHWFRFPYAKSNVYYSPFYPFVLKSSKDGNVDRIRKNAEIQALCNTHHLLFLKVPHAYSFKHYVVEERLPVHSFHHPALFFKEQVGLYIENLRRFDRAIRNFVTLTHFAHSLPQDFLRTHSLHRTKARYDSFALYLEGKEGKIGLLDLKKWSTTNERSESYEKYYGVFALFPFHLEIIFDEVIKLNPLARTHFFEFKSISNVFKKDIEELYLKHKNFLIDQKVRFPDLMRPVFANLKREDVSKICTEILSKMAIWNKERSVGEDEELYGFLGGQQEENLRRWEENLPQIFSSFCTELCAFLVKQEQNSHYCPVVMDKFILSRTLVFKEKVGERSIYQAMCQMNFPSKEWMRKKAVFLPLISFSEELSLPYHASIRYMISHRIRDAFFQEMEKQHLIARFIPHYCGRAKDEALEF